MTMDADLEALLAGVTAEVAHEEQVRIWAEELATDLDEDLREIGDQYDDAVRRSENLRWAARRLAEKVLTHPALAAELAQVKAERDEALERGETAVRTGMLLRVRAEGAEAAHGIELDRRIAAETALAAANARVEKMREALAELDRQLDRHGFQETGVMRIAIRAILKETTDAH
jgi:hypothetical protein